jgi:hypothetical protein
LSLELEQQWITLALNPTDFKKGIDSKCGGYKLVSLISLLFANSDEKHGEEKKFLAYLSTSKGIKSTHIRSCGASRYFVHEHNAGPILKLSSDILNYCEFKKDLKHSETSNNLEQNCINGLKDPCTISELKAMCLLGEIILIPFLFKVRLINIYILVET